MARGGAPTPAARWGNVAGVPLLSVRLFPRRPAECSAAAGDECSTLGASEVTRMNDSRPVSPRPGQGNDIETLPARAVNLARRVLELERQCAGRGRLELQVIMADGEWWFTFSKPGPVERLGD